MLSALALLLLAASSTHHVAAVDFQGFSSWLSGCSRQNSSVCTSSLALTLNFVYSQVLEKVRQVSGAHCTASGHCWLAEDWQELLLLALQDWAPDEGAITAACRLCAQPLQSSFNSSAALANQQGELLSWPTPLAINPITKDLRTQANA